MGDIKKDQPFHQNNNVTSLATRRASIFLHSGVNKSSYCFQAAQYLEARDRTITEMTNLVTKPLTGA